MEYSVERVRALAKTARVALTEEEEAALCRELDAMRSLAEELLLAPLDGGAADPFSGAVPLDRLREDRAVQSSEAAAWAKRQTEHGFFSVPRAVEESV